MVCPDQHHASSTSPQVVENSDQTGKLAHFFTKFLFGGAYSWFGGASGSEVGAYPGVGGLLGILKSEAISNAPFWYTYTYGMARFIVLSTEHALVEGSTQRKWLEVQLGLVDRCQTPWLVVMMHRPLYVI